MPAFRSLYTSAIPDLIGVVDTVPVLQFSAGKRLSVSLKTDTALSIGNGPIALAAPPVSVCSPPAPVNILGSKPLTS